MKSNALWYSFSTSGLSTLTRWVTITHMNNIAILQLGKETGNTRKSEKFLFGRLKLKYLGQIIISRNSIPTDPDKYKAIQSIHAPK